MKAVEPTEFSSAPPTASHARYWVVVFGMSLAVISFIDRVALAQAAPLISKSLNLTKTQMGTIFSAFLLSYAVFGVPSAWSGDKVGARSGLLRIVSAWSLFTALTGMAWNFVSMATIQFFFGMFDAGCFPLITKSFRSWLVPDERTKAQAFLWVAARWGAAFTPLIVVGVLHYMNWRWAFVLFGAMATVWLILFARWYQDDPQQHPGANAQEKALLSNVDIDRRQHHSVQWSKMLRSRSVLLLSLQYYFLSFAWFFYITWLPTYLQEQFHLSARLGAGYAVFPLFFCGLGSLFCGLLTTRISRWTGSLARTRKLMACTGFLAAGCCLSLAAHAPTLNTTIALMAAGCFFNDLVIPHAWASSMDIGGANAASSVAGVMNFMGNIAGISSSMLGGILLERTHNNWNFFISILGAVYFLGVFCWPFIDTTKSFDQPAEHPAG